MRSEQRVFAIRRHRRSRRQTIAAGVGVALLAIIVVVAVPASGWFATLWATASPEVYTVAPGDTLVDISQKSGTPTERIVALNQLDSPDLIQAGQDLKLAGEPEQQAGGTDLGERTYIVAADDNLWHIASQFGVDFEALIDRNALPDADTLAAGQKLIIPSPDARVDAATRGGERPNPTGRIWVPFRTQLDGLPTSGSNCGPSTLGMAMSYFDEWWTTGGIRKDVNQFQGTWGVDAGTSWEAMSYSARKRGFSIVGAVDANGEYHRWNVDELVQQTRAGRPVILLTRYWSLPGHSSAGWYGDHYIVFVGLTPGGDIVYHDAAFPDEAGGAYRMMSRDQLTRAWTRTYSGLQYTAMALDWPGRN